MLPLLLSLRRVNLKNISIAVLAILVFSTLSYIRLQTIERQKAELVYKYPKTAAKTRIVKVTGPVRIVTRIVERPTGEKETTIEEDRSAITESTDSLVESTPVPLKNTLSLMDNRWLVGVGLDNFSPKEFSSYRFYGGYSWSNRVDLAVGGQYDSKFIPSVLVMLRF